MDNIRKRKRESRAGTKGGGWGGLKRDRTGQKKREKGERERERVGYTWREGMFSIHRPNDS